MKLNMPKDKRVMVQISSTEEADKIIDILNDNLDIANLKDNNSVSSHTKNYYYSAFQIGFDKGKWETISGDLTNRGSSTIWKNPITLQQFIDQYEVKDETKNNPEFKVEMRDNKTLRCDQCYFKDKQCSRNHLNPDHNKGRCIRKIGEIWVKVQQKEKPNLLVEANKRYPKGTKFIDLVNGIEFEVSLSNSAEYMNDGTMYVSVEPHKEHNNKRARVYGSGQWAKIIVANQEFSMGDWVYVESGGSGCFVANDSVACVCNKTVALSFSSYDGELKSEQAELYVFNQNKSYGLCKGYKVRKATKEEVTKQYEKGYPVTDKVPLYTPKFPSYVYSYLTNSTPKKAGIGMLDNKRVQLPSSFSAVSMRGDSVDAMQYWRQGITAKQEIDPYSAIFDIDNSEFYLESASSKKSISHITMNVGFKNNKPKGGEIVIPVKKRELKKKVNITITHDKFLNI